MLGSAGACKSFSKISVKFQRLIVQQMEIKEAAGLCSGNLFWHGCYAWVCWCLQVISKDFSQVPTFICSTNGNQRNCWPLQRQPFLARLLCLGLLVPTSHFQRFQSSSNVYLFNKWKSTKLLASAAATFFGTAAMLGSAGAYKSFPKISVKFQRLFVQQMEINETAGLCSGNLFWHGCYAWVCWCLQVISKDFSQVPTFNCSTNGNQRNC